MVTSRIKEGRIGAASGFHPTGVTGSFPLTRATGGFHLTGAGKANRLVSGIRENMDMTAFAIPIGSAGPSFPVVTVINLLLQDFTKKITINLN